MKKITVFVFLLLFALKSGATHNMASDISYTYISGNTFKITVRTFTNTDPATTQADRCEIVIYFGDGDSVMAPRINGPANNCTSADGEQIDTFIKKNIYETTHTYPGFGIYTVSIEDPNRVSGICNIPNSVDVSFWLGAEIKLSSFSSSNSSPQYTGTPMVTDTVGIVSYYTPLLIEADSDSLSYELITPMSNGMPVAGYTQPASSTDFSINPVTGLVTWNAPTMICNFVYAIKITEWRTIAGAVYAIGSTMQEVWNQGAAYTGILERQYSLMRVYPNPSSGTVNFSVPETLVDEFYSLKILNSLGQQVTIVDGKHSSETLTLKNLGKGTYFYILMTASGKAERGTFIVSDRY